jgi:hypothetical protein
MERNTLIKVFALGMVIFFTLELFAMRSSVTNQSTQSNATSNDTSVYGAGVTNATLMTYMDYIDLSEVGVDLSKNASIGELSSIEGVGFINNQSGMVTLVLSPGANLTGIAQQVKGRFPNITVTARALFSVASDVEFSTQLGKKNVSIPFLLQIETEPNIDVGDNVTISLAGILYGDNFAESPVARIIPTEMDATTNAVVASISDQYDATIELPWERRNVNISMVKGELPTTITNVSVNYTPDSPASFVAIKGLSSESNATAKKIGNLSYVTEVNGDLVYVSDNMNDSGKLSADLKSILGGNITLDYPLSTIVVHFSSKNFSKDDILKPIGGELILNRGMMLTLGGKLKIGSVEYKVPRNTSFNVSLLNGSYSIGSNVSVELGLGTIGKNIVTLNLTKVLS